MKEPKFKIGDKVWYMCDGQFFKATIIKVSLFIAFDCNEYWDYTVEPKPSIEITLKAKLGDYSIPEDRIYKAHTYQEICDCFWGDEKIYDFNSRKEPFKNCESHFSAPEKIAFKIFADISDRRGIKHELEKCDDEVIEEIFQSFLEIAKEEINKL